MKIQKTLFASLLATAILFAGCTTRPPPHPPTLGRQLIDLKEAHDKGALTDQEFVDLKLQEFRILKDHIETHEHPMCGVGEPKGPGSCGCHHGDDQGHHEHKGEHEGPGHWKKDKHGHACHKEK